MAVDNPLSAVANNIPFDPSYMMPVSADYTPDQVAYVQNMNAQLYAANQAAQQTGGTVQLAPQYQTSWQDYSGTSPEAQAAALSGAPLSGPVQQLMSSDQLSALMQANPTLPEGALQTVYNATNNQGQVMPVAAGANDQIQLVDRSTGQTVFSGTGPDAAKQAAAMASQLSQSQGNNANWIINTQPSGSNTWVQTASSVPQQQGGGLLGTLADIALPIAGTLLAGPLGLGALGLGSAGTGALGAALGSGISSAAQGRPLGQSVLDAALAGGGSYLGGSLFGAGPGSGAISGSAGNDVLAGSSAVDDLSSNAGGALANAAQGTVEGLTVNAPTLINPSNFIPALTAGAAGGIAPQIIPNFTDAYSAPSTTGGDLVVNAPQPPTAPQIDPALTTGALLANMLSPTGSPAITPTSGTPTSGAGSSGTAGIIKNVVNAALLAGALSGGGSGGSGGGAGAGGVTPTGIGQGVPGQGGSPGTIGALSSIFGAQLPAPSGLFANLGTRAPQVADWTRYAIDNPEQAFFNYAGGTSPLAATPPAAQTPVSFAVPGGNVTWGAPANVDINKQLAAATGYGGAFGSGGFDNWIQAQPESVKAIARQILAANNESNRIDFAGGGHVKDFAVHGPGDGRSDEIPAKLSNGEYVMDAETVSLLGNGSSEAGAKKLDQFRVNLRRQKGAQLAKGKFSANAKAPEAYMTGGRK